jgi:hypothetical protein
MNSPPYHFNFTTLTDDDLVTAWQIHQRLREHLNTEDIIAAVHMAMKYGDFDRVPLLRFADVILAFYAQLADYLEGVT